MVNAEARRSREAAEEGILKLTSLLSNNLPSPLYGKTNTRKSLYSSSSTYPKTPDKSLHSIYTSYSIFEISYKVRFA